MKVVAIIPARKGSKRLEGKNKLLFCGKPLICWTIEEALKCDFIDHTIISTNDEDIIKIYDEKYHNNNYIILEPRPDELAQDDTPIWKVIEHALQGYTDNTIVLLLQPTSPLRTKEDILNAWDLFSDNGDCVISLFKLDATTYRINGAIYFDYLHSILKNKGFELSDPYIMPKERSIDIDTLEDFKEAEKIMKERLEKDE